MRRVVCIGECMVELRESGTDCFARSYAGDVYNTAVYLKRSLPETTVQLLTATGDDAMSAAMRLKWRSEQIDDSLAICVEGGTPGLYLIETDHEGERRFYYWRRQSAARRWWSVLEACGNSVLEGADLIYFSGVSLAILPSKDRTLALQLLGRLRGQVGRIAFDPNVRPSLWASHAEAGEALRMALSMADVALPSRDDLAWMLQVEQAEVQADKLKELGVPELALTLGADGALIATLEDRVHLVSPKPERVVDTSGAGDAFNGAYLAARLQGRTPVEAGRAGLALAARVVAHPGAVISRAASHGL